MTAKTCRGCKQRKPLTREFFYPTQYTSTGYTCRCRVCLSTYARERYRTKLRVSPNQKLRGYKSQSV